MLTRFLLADEWQQEILLVGWRSSSSRFALILSGRLELVVANQFEPLLDVQGLEVHFGDSVIVKDRILFDLVLVEDCEHFAQGRLLLVRAWPMPSCSTKFALAGNLQRESRTCEILRRHCHVSNPLLEQTLLRSYPRWRRRWARWAHNL